MKKLGFIVILILLSSLSFSQKVKTKNDTAYVDEKPYIIWKTAKAGNEISVFGLESNQEELFISYLYYDDPAKVTSNNKTGRVYFIELNFLTLKKKCEIDRCTQNALVKLLLDNKIYVDGVFNADNAEILIQKYGTRYSDNKPNNINININTN